MSDDGTVHERFSGAFAAVGAIKKASKNAHHGYAYRGIDDVMSALHGILADHGLFYVPRCVGETYEEWQTSKGNRLQLARLSYELTFYAPDGSSLTVGPVVGQSADTDDKAPMQALSQAAKVALLHAFCIPTEDMSEGDSASPLSAGGGRVAASKASQGAAGEQAPAAPAQPAGDGPDWEAIAAEAGISKPSVLKLARTAAMQLGVDLPKSLDEIAGPQLEGATLQAIEGARQ